MLVITQSSVRRRGKNIDSSSKSNPVENITTRRCEGVGVVVKKK